MATKATLVKKGDARYINIRMPDGRMAMGYVEDDGHLYIVEDIENPPPSGSAPSSSPTGTAMVGGSGTGGSKAEAKAQATSGQAQVEYDITDKAFTAQLNSVMKDNKYDRVVRHRTRGKIDLKGLPRAEMKREDVFKRKSERKNRHYNVLVLVDESGSMAGYKAARAGEAVRFLAEHLQSIEGVRVAVMGFNHVNTMHKTFNEPRKTNYADLEQDVIYNSEGDDAGCNHDYDAVQESFRLLSKESEGQNFLLYLSDGSPASCDSSHKNDSDVIANMIRSARAITTIGIGIQYDPQQIPHRIVIQNLSELKPKILNALRAHILRG